MRYAVSICLLALSLVFLGGCGARKRPDEINWKDAMEKYRELVTKRDEVIKLMQEKSRNGER